MVVALIRRADFRKRDSRVELIRRAPKVEFIRGVCLDREVLCTGGMMTCQVHSVARVSQGMR